jgi:hypothetical protein
LKITTPQSAKGVYTLINKTEESKGIGIGLYTRYKALGLWGRVTQWFENKSHSSVQGMQGSTKLGNEILSDENLGQTTSYAVGGTIQVDLGKRVALKASMGYDSKKDLSAPDPKGQFVGEAGITIKLGEVD